MPNAEGPGRAGQPGVGGGGPAPGDAPAPEEAKKSPAKPFGAPASGVDSEPIQYSDRAQERYRQLTSELKEAKEELAKLREQKPEPSAQPWQRQASAGGGAFEKQVGEWMTLARKSFETDPDQFVQAIDQITSIKATASAHDALRGFFEEQQQREQQTRFVNEANLAWDRATREFPELNDEGTEFYQTSKRVWESDPYLKQIPDGMFKAAQIAWAERTRKSSKPKALESSGVAHRPSQDDDLSEERSKAIEAARGGNRDAIADFFGKNLNRVIRKS